MPPVLWGELYWQNLWIQAWYLLTYGILLPVNGNQRPRWGVSLGTRGTRPEVITMRAGAPHWRPAGSIPIQHGTRRTRGEGARVWPQRVNDLSSYGSHALMSSTVP